MDTVIIIEEYSLPSDIEIKCIHVYMLWVKL